MRSRWFGWSGWAVALVLALATVGVPHGLAEESAQFADGAFVRAADGSLWVVSRGTKIGIASTPDSAGAIPGLKAGPTVGTAAELAQALMGLGGAAAPSGGQQQQQSPPAQSGGQQQQQSPPATSSGQSGGAPASSGQSSGGMNAAQNLVGQAAEGCYGTARFYVLFDRAELVKNAGGRSAPGNAMWLIGVATVQNVGAATDVPATTIVLVDDFGRQFDPSSDVAFTSAVANTAGVKIPYDLYAPGTAEQTVFVYAIPPDVQRVTPKSANVACQ